MPGLCKVSITGFVSATEDQSTSRVFLIVFQKQSHGVCSSPEDHGDAEPLPETGNVFWQAHLLSRQSLCSELLQQPDGQTLSPMSASACSKPLKWKFASLNGPSDRHWSYAYMH